MRGKGREEARHLCLAADSMLAVLAMMAGAMILTQKLTRRNATRYMGSRKLHTHPPAREEQQMVAVAPPMAPPMVPTMAPTMATFNVQYWIRVLKR